MAADARRAFARRSWHLHVTAVLQEAATRGDAAALALLLRCHGRDVDARDQDGSTALHAAAAAGHAAAARLLLDGGAECDAATNYSDTPLHCAAAEARLATAELLVARRADPCARTRSGRTPLDNCARHEGREAEALRQLLRSASEGCAIGA